MGVLYPIFGEAQEALRRVKPGGLGMKMPRRNGSGGIPAGTGGWAGCGPGTGLPTGSGLNLYMIAEENQAKR